MNATAVRHSIAKMYSRLNYSQFCSYMGLNPKYDEKYWTAFQTLANTVAQFDDANLQKILDFENNAAHDAEHASRISVLCRKDLHRECDDSALCHCGCHSRPNQAKREKST